ncbi:uncharacterized protein LOC144648098 [Oculina patagonica]
MREYERQSRPTTVDIFADDTTLSSSSPYTDTSGLCSRLCESTRELEDWTRNNRFKLNIEKTKCMFVTGSRLRTKIGSTGVDEMKVCTSSGEALDNTTSHKLLGVHVDQDLSFNEHVDHLCKKLAKRLGVLRSIRHYLPLNERILFYNATIKPIFLYGGAVWSSTSKSNIRRIFRLQKRAARVILGVKTRDERTVSLFKRLDWLPFYDEITVNKLCLIYKCLNGQCPEYLRNRLVSVNDMSTRTSRYGDITLRCPRYNRETEGGRTFLVSATKCWNSLPIYIRTSTSIKAFKHSYSYFIKEGYADLDSFPMS